MPNQYRIYQASTIITVSWGPAESKRRPWMIVKMLDPDTLEPEAAEITSHTTPSIPVTAGKARANSRDWEFAADIANRLDHILVNRADFQNVTLKIEPDAGELTYFTTSGRLDSKRGVTIHTPQ